MSRSVMMPCNRLSSPQTGREPMWLSRVMRAAVSRSETRFRVVSCGFTAGSAAWLGPSRGAAITRLPPGVSAPVECILGRVAMVPEAVMCAHAVTVNDVLDGHVALDIQSLDRIY